jgi:chromosomal replication initiator protein
LRREDITINLTKHVLKNILGNISFAAVNIDQIVRIICREMKVSERQIMSKSRTMDIALARQIAMYFCKELTETSLANIGVHIGGRDHSTVIHACKNIEKKIQTDGDFKLRIQNMKNQISV